MKNIILFLILNSSCVLFAQPELKIKSASIKFSIKNAGLKVDGKFTGFEAQINFNTQDVTNSKIEAKIDVNTLNTDINARDKHLKKEEYFDIEKYPKITFVSTEFTQTKADLYQVTCELSIKNVKKKIQFPFTYVNKTFKGNFAINRRDFGVGGNSWIMSDKVLVDFEVIIE
ncbi:MAG: polyisoprenoid-binding protein [Bacteroidetes bacterium]|nr:MAG: polyisoprenoid-binding protein [Bacteroidota bacterium]